MTNPFKSATARQTVTTTVACARRSQQRLIAPRPTVPAAAWTSPGKSMEVPWSPSTAVLHQETNWFAAGGRLPLLWKSPLIISMAQRPRRGFAAIARARERNHRVGRQLDHSASSRNTTIAALKPPCRYPRARLNRPVAA